MNPDVAIPLFADVPHYSVLVTLEGTVYAVRMYFEDVDGYWYFTLLDEAESTAIGGVPRRVLPIGPWLTVDEPLTVAQLRDLYGLANRVLPGLLLFASSQPLTLTQADGAVLQLQYFNAATVAAAS